MDDQRALDTRAVITQAQDIGIVSEAQGPEDTVVCATGGMPGDLLKSWGTGHPKGCHVEYGFSCMGYEISGRLSVKLAAPEREALVMVGDGSYLVLHTEIVTAAQEGQRLILVLVDSGGFECTRGLQMSSGLPSFGNEVRFRGDATGILSDAYVLVTIVRNAKSLGDRAIAASGLEEIKAALEEAKAETRTTLVIVRVAPDVQVPNYDRLWDVPIADLSEQEPVNTTLSEYEDSLRKQRWFG